MLYYPQLTTGAVCQFPVSRRTRTRTITNELLGGDSIRMADAAAGSVGWQLQYTSLSDAEWSSIEHLFEAAEGRLGSFTFLDPTDNLLMWSEDWTRAVWTAGPLLQVGTGITDPVGTNSACQITNTSQTTQRLTQTITGASWFQYCYSVYLRSDTLCAVQLVISTNGEESLDSIVVGPAWRRAVKRGSLSAQQDGISFGIQLPAGNRVAGFGAQVEAQAAAGYYKKTIDLGGVYSNTRFDSDALSRRTDGPNQNSCALNLVSNLV